jgi:neuroligin
VDCLRKRKVEEILSVDLRIPDHLTAFGPIIDSIVVPSDPRKQLQTTNSKLNTVSHNVGTQYDLLFGANKLEGPCLFAAHEEKHGIDPSRRDRILRTLVRNLFDFHQQVINEF